jgi:hypothetical protein
MPTASSADRALDVPSSVRAAMVVLGFVPVIHLTAVLTPVVLALAGGRGWLLALAPGILYLLPPLMVRLGTWLWPLPVGEVDLASPAFLCWWFTAQCQIIFARLPWLEELLRLVPALYSVWLRLWGAKIGALAYWSPGVTILDRSLVHIGDRVAFGAGTRLIPHAIAPMAGAGHVVLYLAPVTIGSDALVGAYSTLLPGCVVAPGEITPPFRTIHAGTRFEGGRRSRLPELSRTGSADASVTR